MKEVDGLLASRKAKPYHYFEKAWGLFQSHKFIEAIALFDRYIQLGGKDQYTYFYRGSCERALNHLEEADKDFRKSLEIEDSFIDAQLALGDVLINQ
jgi:tetratricopeptide (TPR) repeat protein